MTTRCIEEHKTDQLNKLSKTLTNTFNEHFGEQALLKYYHGKIKVQKRDENGNLAFKGNGDPWIISQDSRAPHFSHEALADDLDLHFVELHGTLQRAFMVEALHKKTKNNLYANLKADLFDDFIAIARKQKPELSNAEINTVKETLESSVTFMIEDTHQDDDHSPVNEVA